MSLKTKIWRLTCKHLRLFFRLYEPYSCCIRTVLGQIRSAHLYSFLLYSFSLKVSCEGHFIFCISRTTLKLDGKNKVDSLTVQIEKEAVRLLFLLLVCFHRQQLEVGLKMFILLVSCMSSGSDKTIKEVKTRYRCQCCTAEAISESRNMN